MFVFSVVSGFPSSWKLPWLFISPLGVAVCRVVFSIRGQGIWKADKEPEGAVNKASAKPKPFGAEEGSPGNTKTKNTSKIKYKTMAMVRIIYFFFISFRLWYI